MLVFLVLLVSCNNDANEKPDIDINKPLPTSIEDISTEPITIQYIPMTAYYRTDIVDEEYKENWLVYIRETFGIDLKIPFSTDHFDGYNGIAQAELISNPLITKGLVAFPPMANSKLYELADAGKILPLTEILKDNETWSNLPNEMKSMYEYRDEIWAIPGGYSTSFYTRTVGTKYLDKFGMDVPETFDELEILFRRLTRDDPDGDGIDNTTGADVSIWYVIDIFNNMDCFLQHVDNKIQVTSIAYDKNEGVFKDCMFSDDIEQPLNYIKGMLDEGIVVINRPTDIKVMTSAYYTAFGTYGKELIWGYDGNNNNPLAINYYENFIVAADGMGNATEAINKFVDVFYGNHEAYLCAVLGLPDEAYKIRGEVEILRNDMQTNNMPYIVGYNPNIEAGLEYSGETEQYYRRIGNEQATELSLLEDAFIIPTDIIFAIKERVDYMTINMSNDIEVRGDVLLGLFGYYYNQIMNGFMTVDEGVAAYRARANELGVEDYLAELNNKLNE